MNQGSLLDLIEDEPIRVYQRSELFFVLRAGEDGGIVSQLNLPRINPCRFEAWPEAMSGVCVDQNMAVSIRVRA